MFRNYFKTAWRNLWKNKLSAGISIAGLAVGMACCLLITIYITEEISFNNGNAYLKNIYRINWLTKQTGNTLIEATTPIIIARSLTPSVAGIDAVARLYQRSGQMQVTNTLHSREEKKFQEQNTFFADESLFKIFSIDFIKGNFNAALTTPNSIVLTDEMANKYFGTTDVLGKAFFYDNKQSLQITGVVKKMPVNSDLQFDFLISFETLFSVEKKELAAYLKTDWTFNPVSTYCLLKKNTPPSFIQDQLNALLKKNGSDRNRQMNTLSLQPLSAIHLHAANVTGNPSTNTIVYIYIFAAIALLILFISNINFINLAISHSVTRTKEISLRKVMGASKHSLVLQFLCESLLVSFLAFVLAFMLAIFSVTALNSFTGGQLSIQQFFQTQNLLIFGFIFLVSGILAGLYPSFIISCYPVILALKGKSGDKKNRNIVRKVLLTSQFIISIILITGAIVIYKQLQYIRNKPLGFQKNQMLIVPVFGTGSSSISYGVDAAMRQRMNAFTHELLTNSKIKAVTAASEIPGQGFVSGLIIPEGFSKRDNIFMPWLSVDYNFLDALNIPFVAGRNFAKNTGTDHLNAFILNESAVHFLGWKNPENAIGKSIIRGDEQNGKKGHVIGVIKDFNFNTLDQPMQPLIMDVNASRFTQFAINVQADHLPQTIAYVKQLWSTFFPERVFEYSFLDKNINKLYSNKENLSDIIEFFALITILLSCIGLFGLASFLSQQRTKEIGIRKVLGAGVLNIIFLLSKEFLIIVLIAFVIAVPVAFYYMHLWLQGFAYRINMNWWIFLIAGLIVASIAMFTLSFQAIKAAIANPVKSLRSE